MTEPKPFDLATGFYPPRYDDVMYVGPTKLETGHVLRGLFGRDVQHLVESGGLNAPVKVIEGPYQHNVYPGSGYIYLRLANGATVTLPVGWFAPTPAPEPLKVGDYVVWAQRPGTTYSGDHFSMKRVTMVDPKYKGAESNCGILMIEGSGTRFYANRWRKVDPKTYVEPKFKYRVGDVVYVPEKMEATCIANLGTYSIINRKLYINYVGGTPANPRYEVRDTDSGGERLLSASNIDAFTELCPKDWKPRAVEVNLNILTYKNVHLTMPSYGSCCGAKILYNFYGLDIGTAYNNLAGNDERGRPYPPNTKITEEMFEAAIRNTLRDYCQGTGVVTSVLATTQIGRYGPILERCGFVKLREYPNYNHGPHHMNAMYAYYVEDARKQKKVEEKARAFG